MRTSIDGIDLIKTCPKCEAYIKIAETTCKFCGYAWLPTILTEEEAAWSYDQTLEMINDAFFRLETYGAGNSSRYESFDFWRMFSVLFEKTRAPQNQKLKNFSRIEKYGTLIQHLAYDWDKSGFENPEAYQNEAFIKDLDEITYIQSDRDWEFLEFEVPGKKERLSITDILAEEEESLFDFQHTHAPQHAAPSLRDHFEKIREGELTELERFNLAERLTDNFNLEKLKLLEKDLGIYISMEADEMEGNFSMEDIAEEIKKLQDRGRPVPKITLPVIKKNGVQVDPDEKPVQVLDKQALLFPYEFVWCYQFRKLLRTKIQETETKLATGPENQAKQKAAILNEKLKALGFFDLETTRNLWPKQQQELIKLIAKNDIPFSIALMDRLGLPAYLAAQTKTKSAVHLKIADLLGCPERTVKGNLNVLNELSREDRTRYTAHRHIQEVNNIISEYK